MIDSQLIESANVDSIQTAASVLKYSSSIPQSYVIQDGGVHLYHAGKAGGELIPGLMVFNDLKPGSVGFATTSSFVDEDGNKRQRLITNLKSNHDVERNRIFDFQDAECALGESRKGQLLMKIYSDQNGDTLLQAFKKKGDLGSADPNIISFRVGPGSISLAPELTREEMAKLGYEANFGIDWKGIASGVISAIPTLAEAGLEIYKQVSGSDKNSEQSAEPEIIGTLLGAVVSVAVPFVSALLSK